MVEGEGNDKFTLLLVPVITILVEVFVCPVPKEAEARWPTNLTVCLKEDNFVVVEGATIWVTYYDDAGRVGLR